MKVLAQFKLNYIKIIYCSLTSIVFEIDEAVIFSKDSLNSTWTENEFLEGGSWKADFSRAICDQTSDTNHSSSRYGKFF